MKKLTFITLLFFIGFINSQTLLSQDSEIFSFMEEHLNDTEAKEIEKAKGYIKKGDKLDSKIKTEDKKVQKYFSKKKKKGEKKSAEVKELRIKQAMYYEKAYAQAYNTYSKKIDGLSYIYEEDENKARGYLERAAEDNTAAQGKMKKYKGVSPKDLKKKIEYNTLKSDLQSVSGSYTSAIKNLIEAYSIFLDQETKQQLEEEENRAWANAESENSIYSYQTYLNDYPSGKYASQARSKISQLEEEERRRKEESARNLKGNLIYQVQIAASRKALPKWKINRFYKKTKDVTMKNYDGWYKYSVGSFKTYEEAKRHVSTVRIKGAFVVAYLNGEKLDIKEAIKIQ